MESQEKKIIEKSNTLNTLMCENMGLMEFRFFCLYLSKLNARNINNRTVNIPIKEFEIFFNIKFNTYRFKSEIRKIMSRTVEIKEDGKVKILTLYSEFCWNEIKPSTITITCNDKMLPYIFNLKKNYTTYMIGNIAKLNSVSKIRLYEICKQYEKIGIIKIQLQELQKMMCVNIANFRDFRSKRLEPAIKDINQYTDIQVSYEKNLACRKVVALTFTIKSKNQIQIEPQKAVEFVESVENNVESTANDVVNSVYLKCQKVYTIEQVQNLMNLAEMISSNPGAYIISIYYNITARDSKINNIYKYTLSIIQAELRNTPSNQPVETQKPKNRETTYDLDEFEEFIRNTPRDMGGHQFSVFNEDGRLIAYIKERDFDSIKDGTWKTKYPNCRIDEISNRGLKLIDLINS